MKLGRLLIVAMLVSVMGSVLASRPLTTKTAHALPLPPPLAAADLDNDGSVTLGDLIGFVTVWAWNSTNPGWNQPIPLPGTWRNASAADFNLNNKIDLGDLVTIAYCYALNNTKV